MTQTNNIPENLTKRIQILRDNLLTGLVERDIAIRLALIAALSGEHLLMIGPPGTAKSLVARRLHLAFGEAVYFERLLTRFTVPEELFGPLSIKGLEEDRYERLTQSYLPTSSIAFLDEIFKANSAILNALLTILNEREFDNGINREQTPLIAVIGASNELPEGEELNALFDRFLLRLHVGPVSKAAFPRLIGLRDESVSISITKHLQLSIDDIVAVQKASQKVNVPDDVTNLLCDMRDFCIAEEIEVSDRRWRKIVKLLQISALTNGRDKVSIWDCWLLQHCIWNQPETKDLIYYWYAKRVGANATMNPSRLTKIVVSWEGKLQQDRDSRSQVRDKKGNLLYIGNDNEPTLSTQQEKRLYRNNEELYLAPTQSANINIQDRTNNGQGYTRKELESSILIKLSNSYYQSHFRDWDKRYEYLADKSNWLTRVVDLPPHMEPTRQKKAYINSCLNEIKNLKEEVNTYQISLKQHINTFKAEINSHLWVMSEFAEVAAENLQQTTNEVNILFRRIERLKSGFELLPKEQ